MVVASLGDGMKRWRTWLILIALGLVACNGSTPGAQVAPDPAAEEGMPVVPVGGTQLPVPIELPAATPEGPTPTKNLAIRFPEGLAISVEEMTSLGEPAVPAPAAAASVAKSLKQVAVPVAPTGPLSVLPGARPGVLVDGPSEMVAAMNALLERYLSVVSVVRADLQGLAIDAAIPPLEQATLEGGKVKIDFAPIEDAADGQLRAFSENALELACPVGCARNVGEVEAGLPLCYRVWVQPAGGAAQWRRFMIGKFLRLPGAADRGAGCFRAVSAGVLVQLAEGESVTEAELFAAEELLSGWRYDQADPTDRRLEGFLSGRLGASAAMQAAGAVMNGLHVTLREIGPSMDVAEVQLNGRSSMVTGPTAPAVMRVDMQLRGHWRRDGDLLRTSVAMERTVGETSDVLGHVENICLAMSTGYQTLGCPDQWALPEPVVALPTSADTSMPVF